MSMLFTYFWTFFPINKYVKSNTYTQEKKMHFMLDYFESIAIKLKKASIARKTYRELNGLSNAELKDIGINRGDIRAISQDVFYNNYPISNRNLKGWA
jgi:hypothetical protein